MPRRHCVFIVDDDEAILDYYRKIFMPEIGEYDILGTPPTPTRMEDLVDLRLFGRPSELLAAFSAELAAGSPVPLCILDMRMPEQSGLELSLTLRELDPEVCIIICSAFSDASADTLKDRLHKGIYLVYKPFASDEFRLLVHSLLREWEGRRTLRQNEERLRRIIEATRVGTWEWNIQTGELIINGRWAEIIGYSLAELAPTSITTWSALVHPEDGARSQELLKRYFSGELEFYEIECRIRHKDGRWIWIQDHGQVVERDQSGAPLWMSGTHSDISDRKNAEIKRREVEQRLAWALEAADEGIWDWDIRTGWVTHNARWCGILGLDGSFLEHPLSAYSERIHDEDRPMVLALIQSCLGGNAPYACSYRMVRPDGRLVWVLDRGKVVLRDEEGTPMRMVGSISDITQSKNAEAELVAMNVALQESNVKSQAFAKAAMQASLAKSSFLANMSHEIRTPLNAIIGFSDIVRGGELSSDQRTHMDTIVSSGHHLLSIINDILDFSKIESGKIAIESIEVDVRKIIADLLAMFRTRMPSSSLSLSATIADDVPVSLCTDPTRLKQVLVNLLSNAVKFTKKGEIAVSVTFVKEADEPGYLRFAVRDTGIGIPLDRQSAIFEAFEQVDGSTTRKYGGTGLGLAISRSLVANMGGSFFVESEPGKGSTFSFNLPFDNSCRDVAATRTFSRSRSLSSEGLKGLRVLVAEDVETNRLLISAILKAMGCVAEFAKDGMEALSALRRGGFDLCLMDIQMPRMGGIETTSIARAEGIRVPIVALTAAVSSEDADACRKAGMQAFVTKPIERQNLITVMLSVTRR